MARIDAHYFKTLMRRELIGEQRMTIGNTRNTLASSSLAASNFRLKCKIYEWCIKFQRMCTN